MNLEHLQKARNHVVGGDGGRKLDNLLRIKELSEGLKDRIWYLYLQGHGIGQGEDRTLLLIKERTVLPALERIELRLADPLLKGDGGMLICLVRGPIQYCDPHDDELAQGARDAGFLADGGQVVEPALGHGRALQQHLI